jgi:nuclear protein localization family protein 4
MNIILERIYVEHNIKRNDNHYFSFDQQGKNIINKDFTIRKLRIKNGDQIFLHINEDDVIINSSLGKVIVDGSIVNKVVDDKGFRPGLRSLKSIKNHWTLTDFQLLNQQFEFNIKSQKESICKKVSIDSNICNNFQSYMRKLNFNQCRIGYLYGTVKNNEVKVEVMYEPLQKGTKDRFELLEDPQLDKVEKLISALSFKKVGWIFAHPEREKGFIFSGLEILTTAIEQLEDANGINDTPFVTIRASLVNDMVEFDAFQVSNQCMKMVAECFLIESADPTSLTVDEPATAIVEGKLSNKIDNNFFLVNVPIAYEESKIFITKFYVIKDQRL